MSRSLRGVWNVLISLHFVVTASQAFATEQVEVNTPNGVGAPYKKAKLDCDKFSNSVFKIEYKGSNTNHLAPWQPPGQTSGYGTGFLIHNDLILTAAHLVKLRPDVVDVLHPTNKRYEATVVDIADKFDLALLKVNDPEFYRDLIPLQLGDMPERGADLQVFSFSSRGNGLQTVNGVLSAIISQAYSYGGSHLTKLMYDAAGAGGSSGAPVIDIEENKVCGVHIEGGNGAGYAVPIDLVKRYITLFECGKGTKGAGIPILQKKLSKLERKMFACQYSGMQIANVVSATCPLLRDDIVIEVNGIPIDDEMLFALPGSKGNRANCRSIWESLEPGETLNMKVWRQNQIVDLVVPVCERNRFTMLPDLFGEDPRWWFFGGIGFVETSSNLIRTLEGTNATTSNPNNWLIQNLRNLDLRVDRKEGMRGVMIAEILPSAELTEHMEGYKWQFVYQLVFSKKISGDLQIFDTIEVFNLLQMYKAIRYYRDEDDVFIQIRTLDGSMLTFDVKNAFIEGEKVRRKNRITEPGWLENFEKVEKNDNEAL